MPPELATVQQLTATPPVWRGRRPDSNRSLSIKPGSQHRINLKMVAEALADEGLDPTTEMIRILKAKVPLTTRGGVPVLDAKGEPVLVNAIDDDVRLRTLGAMLEYTQPKLKAIEMKLSGHLDLSDEQIDARLHALMAKVARDA